MLEKQVLFVKLVGYVVHLYYDLVRRVVKRKVKRFTSPSSIPPSLASDESRSIVIVGASFAGYHAARTIATTLPPGSPYKVVIIEPNSHFQFTWVLPRFCVVPGHDHKAFIPYGPYLVEAKDSVEWIRDRVESIDRKCVKLQNGETVPYEFLIVATGSAHGGQLPSRVGTEAKVDGMKRLQDMQRHVEEAKKVVVVGGGAAGVELAADMKEYHPSKDVVLIHSRSGVMNRFGPELQQAALKGLKELGVDVILNDRVASESLDGGNVVLTSGKTIECDYLINCTGQKPASNILADLSPKSISESGHIQVRPTMQIMDDSLPNVYACGDVASLHIGNPNSRSAMHQATVAGDNVVLAATGHKPNATYKRHWADGVIKLTLGLKKSIVHFGDGKSELLFHGKEKDIALMSDGAWKAMGAKPFEDPDVESAGIKS